MINRFRGRPAGRLAILLTLLGAATLSQARAGMHDSPAALIEAGEFSRARDAATLELARDAGDPGARFQRARAHGFLGDYDAALADYDDLLSRFPDNVDYVFGRAQVLGWLGRDREALAVIDRAIELAPDYEALWRLKFSLVERLGDDNLEEFRDSAAGRFPNSGWWQRAVPFSPPADDYERTLTVGADVQDLNNSLPGWSGGFAEFGWQASPRRRYSIRTQYSRRFSTTDFGLGAGAEFRLGDRWLAGIELSGASDPDFLASTSWGGHVGRSFEHGWALDLRYRRREFDTATVSAWTATAEKYFGNFRAAYSLAFAHLHGATDALTHIGTLNWYRGENHSYGITLALGEEAEVVAPGQVLQTDVNSISFTGRHRLSGQWSLSWFAGTHEQGDLYRRRYVGLAAAYRF